MCANGWRSRLLVGLVLWLAARLHAIACADVANTPEGMFVYHATAALVDFVTLVFSAYALEGQLSDDMQTLNFVSMVVNSVGWFAYLAYAPPISYNLMILVLAYVQFIRLLVVDRNDASHFGHHLVWRRALDGTQLYSRTAK